MSVDSDAALVARVVVGDDRAAFELLVRRHQSPLRAFLRRLVLQDAALADDLAQETFIKLHRSIATYRAQARFTTWLYRIAYHVFLGAAVAGGVATATLAPPVERLLDTWAPGGVAAMLGAALMLVIVILPALAVDHYQR